MDKFSDMYSTDKADHLYYENRQLAAPPLYTRHQYPSPSSSYSSPHSYPASPLPDSRQTYSDEEMKRDQSVYSIAKARYDNPLAHNDAWSPTTADAQMMSLPKIDFMLRVKARLERTAGKPFDPPPRSFARPLPRLAARAPFNPLFLNSDGKGGLIGEGFVVAYSGMLASYDVSAADFGRFLEDIFTAGKLSGPAQIISTVAPITMHLGIAGYFVTKAIQKGLMRRKEPLVVQTIETWNQRFFVPRGLDVYVVNKGERTARAPNTMPEMLDPRIAFAADSMLTKKGRKKDLPVLVIAPLC